MFESRILSVVEPAQERMWGRIASTCGDFVQRFPDRVLEAERDVFLGCGRYERNAARRAAPGGVGFAVRRRSQNAI